MKNKVSFLTRNVLYVSLIAGSQSYAKTPNYFYQQSIQANPRVEYRTENPKEKSLEEKIEKDFAIGFCVGGLVLVGCLVGCMIESLFLPLKYKDDGPDKSYEEPHSHYPQG